MHRNLFSSRLSVRIKAFWFGLLTFFLISGFRGLGYTQDAVPVPSAPPHPEWVAKSSEQGYVFEKNVEEVVLHASVLDKKRRLVSGLSVKDFAVLENGMPQQIKSFVHEDMPVAIGILIDSSGSMLSKSVGVKRAALTLVEASNPKDEVFIADFNDHYHLDQDFTSDVLKMQDALDRIRFHGQTAIYDTIVIAADHLKENRRLDKRVLVVVTDGDDNASSYSLWDAIERVERNDGPMIYTVGILDEGRTKQAERALVELAEATGGTADLPHNSRDVDAICREISHDIRNQYTMTYKPSVPWSESGYRKITVQARAHGHKKLTVRTRTGYFAEAADGP